MIQKDPQGSYSTLLSPDALSKVPAAIQHTLIPILKSSLVDSLQSVFIFGLIFVIIGIVFAPFLGKIKISRAEKTQETKNK